MKKLFLLICIACGATAMAKGSDKAATPAQEAKMHIAIIEKNNNDNSVKSDTIKHKKQQIPVTERLSGKNNNPQFNISVFIVDFINKSNLKIAKRLLED
ncbi:hypothetical protein [Flavobacterium sp. MK4S-17]|uniref:hypothetical protein n=1 Tax=Flavobacterium sp. MK4S-17 TaxID=2543737 RepID=UPI00135A8445|nr:hypothetical protein [Flavobacterium sp. MK4S-17]